MLHIRLPMLVPIGMLVCSVVSADSFEWPQATPDQVNVDSAQLTLLDNRISQGAYGRVTSLLIVRHGRLIHESYYNGFAAGDLMPMYSATKSWASGLLGIAIQNGDLESVNSTIDDVFSDYPDVFQNSPSKASIRVADLLTMRHGLEWDEWATPFTDTTNPANQMASSPDWWRYVLSRSATAPANSVFRYSTGVSNLLGGIVYRKTGLTAQAYADAYLFDPLDIRQVHIEVDMTGDPTRPGITQFQTGFTPTGHGLWLRARDMAKLGQLYLDDGVWQRQRILDSEWVEQSWLPYSDHATDPEVFPQGLSYGYQWWTQAYSTDSGPVTVHFAWGFADQYIFVVPELDMVVISTGQNGGYSGPTLRSDFAASVLTSVADDFDPLSDSGLTGSWTIPAQQNQGFMIEVVPSTGQLVAYWMAFDPESGSQMWLFAVGELHGRRATLQFRRPQGGDFSGNSTVDILPWAEAELVFHSCSEATLHFDSEMAGLSGSLALARITPVTTCEER